jgi:hypothetical protein
MGRAYTEHFLRDADTDENEYGEDDLDYGDENAEAEEQEGILTMEESIDERAGIAAAQAAEPKGAGVHWLQMRRVRQDGGTQSRVRLDPMIVSDYAEQFARNGTVTARMAGVSSHQLWWGDFPAVDVYLDGDYWLVDGFHRLAGIDEALKRGGLPEDSRRNWLMHCRVFLGSKREAILHATGANSRHGLRRTNADKRKAVETLLRDDEWQKWSDHEIARRCAVDHKTVSAARQRLELTREIPQSLVRKRADGAEIDTTNIGANQVERLRQPSQPPQPSPATVVYVEPAPAIFSSPAKLENMVWEWAEKHAYATARTLVEVLEFLDEGDSTRANKERRKLGTWLREQGANWRADDDLSQAIRHVRVRQYIRGDQAMIDAAVAKIQAAADPSPETPADPAPTISVLPADLAEAGYSLWHSKETGKWGWNYSGKGIGASCGPFETSDDMISDLRRHHLGGLAFPLTESPTEPVMPADLAEQGFAFVRVGKGMWAIELVNEYQSNWRFEPTDCIADARNYLALPTLPAEEPAPLPAKTLPLPPLPDERLEDAQNLRLCLVECRELCRRQFGELTGRHSLLPAYERAVADLLGPLDSLIGILDEKASA